MKIPEKSALPPDPGPQGPARSARLARALASGIDALPAALELAREAVAGGDTAAGITLCRTIVARDPDNGPAWELLASALVAEDRCLETVAACREALRNAPGSGGARLDLARALVGLGEGEKALSHACDLEDRSSRSVGFEEVMARGHRLVGNFAAARASFERCIKRGGKRADVLLELAAVTRLDGDLPAALDAVDRAIELEDTPAARVERAEILLLQGDYRAAWVDWDLRLALPAMRGTRQRYASYQAPRWDGAPLAGRTLLLGIEQGAGDVFQFARFAHLARQGGGRVLLESRSDQRGLLASAPGVDALVERGRPGEKIHSFLPLLSLPALFGIAPDDLAAGIPYLSPPADRVSAWQSRLPTTKARRIGVVWSGNPRNPANSRRSIPPESLHELATIPGVQWISLQRKPPSTTTETAGQSWLAPVSGMRDFADLAAVMACLDGVVTVDTAAAHIAGATGVGVWTLLSAAPDWRWGTSGESTPWYPEMRLFRQERPGDWAGVVAAVCAALRSEIG